jgi:hypothetical protein
MTEIAIDVPGLFDRVSQIDAETTVPPLLR